MFRRLPVCGQAAQLDRRGRRRKDKLCLLAAPHPLPALVRRGLLKFARKRRPRDPQQASAGAWAQLLPIFLDVAVPSRCSSLRARVAAT